MEIELVGWYVKMTLLILMVCIPFVFLFTRGTDEAASSGRTDSMRRRETEDAAFGEDESAKDK